MAPTPTDPYEEHITDAGNLRMRAVSGRVDDFRPLVAFLYEVGRDLLTTGVLEERIDRIAEHAQPVDGERGPFRFTNGWLAKWAQDAADRLAEPLDVERDVVRVLHQADGLLGLAVHRGEGSTERWKGEAAELILRIRPLAARLEKAGAPAPAPRRLVRDSPQA